MVDTFSIDTSQTAPAGVLPPLALSTASSYDATDDRGRRRMVSTSTMSEDNHANQRQRQSLTATGRDLARNYAVASWSIRKHLDFVSTFRFQAKTPDRGYNAYLEAHVARRNAKDSFDVAGRHNHRRGVRLAEACRTIDGDVFWLKLAPPKGNPWRGKIQAIEGDRVRNPSEWAGGMNPLEWVNGVKVDPKTGRSTQYAICDRVNRSRFQLQRTVPAANIIPLAAYGFRYDQVRGVSPLAAALNYFRDTQEGIEYALAKVKIAQLFGLKIFRQTDTTLTGPYTAAPTVDADGDDEADSGYEVNLNRGPFMLELEPGDNADILESKNPSAETVNFINQIIAASLKALDIPFSFYDESFSTFHGSRGGLIQYLHGAKQKRDDLIEFQDEHQAWRLGLDVEDGELELPSGKDFDYLRWEFIPNGIPFWDTAKENRGAAMGVAAGFTSPQRVCHESGTTFEENIDAIAQAMDYAAAARDGKGVPLVFADSSAFAPEITVKGETDGEPA